MNVRDLPYIPLMHDIHTTRLLIKDPASTQSTLHAVDLNLSLKCKSITQIPPDSVLYIG